MQTVLRGAVLSRSARAHWLAVQVTKKQAVPPAPQLELDVSLGQGPSAVPRLPFDAGETRAVPGAVSALNLLRCAGLHACLP